MHSNTKQALTDSNSWCAGGGAPHPAAASASICCIHNAPGERALAPCVLAQHPDWYYKTRTPGKPRLNAHGFWREPPKAVKIPGSAHDQDVALSEMRQFGNKKMILVLSPQKATSSSDSGDYSNTSSDSDSGYQTNTEHPRDAHKEPWFPHSKLKNV